MVLESGGKHHRNWSIELPGPEQLVYLPIGLISNTHMNFKHPGMNQMLTNAHKGLKYNTVKQEEENL